ncbi:MAG: hypothetical protein J2P50_08770 [Hyphomicrobiaceae bacterium]|nr:hypothetical protein [Hyphomicrobiaceae bacterium]
MDLTTLGSETRSIQLRVGETLRFSFGTEPGPFGTLALVEGPGAPLILLAGAARTDVSFTAPENGAFTFRFGKAGEDAARFTVSCPAGRATYRAEASASPQASNFLPLQPEEIDATGLASEDLKVGEPSVGAQGQPAKNALPPIAVPPGVSLATPQTTRPQIKLSWLDQRYQPSGQGDPQIDPAESGVEIGLNYRLKSAVTIGALAQVNPAIDVPFGVERGLADRGWMAGPVTKIELAPKLLLDARAAWGEGESGPEEATSAAAAQRRLLSARLASEQVFGGWRLTPSVNFNYLEQLPHGFVPETEAAHPIGTGRIDMAPELAYHIDLPAAAFIEPRAVVGGFWDFDNLSKVAPSGAVHPEMRLKAEAGVTIGVRDGAKLQASGGLEGGDREVPDAWTGRLQLSVPLK